MEQKDVQNVDEVEKTETTENTEPTAEQKSEKTFTQSEFKEALKNEVARKTKNLPSKEELKEFNDWKESQKTEAEKQAEVLKENEALKNKILELENIQVVANAGVDSKFQKFVFSEVSGLEGDFEENLKDYIKENPQFLQTTTSAPQNTGVPVSKIKNSEEDGVMAILKSKHPEAF